MWTPVSGRPLWLSHVNSMESTVTSNLVMRDRHGYHDALSILLRCIRNAEWIKHEGGLESYAVIVQSSTRHGTSHNSRIPIPDARTISPESQTLGHLPIGAE